MQGFSMSPLTGLVQIVVTVLVQIVVTAAKTRFTLSDISKGAVGLCSLQVCDLWRSQLEILRSCTLALQCKLECQARASSNVHNLTTTAHKALMQVDGA